MDTVSDFPPFWTVSLNSGQELGVPWLPLLHASLHFRQQRCIRASQGLQGDHRTTREARQHLLQRLCSRNWKQQLACFSATLRSPLGSNLQNRAPFVLPEVGCCLHLLQGLPSLAVLPSALPLILSSCPFLSFLQFHHVPWTCASFDLCLGSKVSCIHVWRTLVPLVVLFVSNERYIMALLRLTAQMKAACHSFCPPETEFTCNV